MYASSSLVSGERERWREHHKAFRTNQHNASCIEKPAGLAQVWLQTQVWVHLLTFSEGPRNTGKKFGCCSILVVRVLKSAVEMCDVASPEISGWLNSATRPLQFEFFKKETVQSTEQILFSSITHCTGRWRVGVGGHKTLNQGQPHPTGTYLRSGMPRWSRTSLQIWQLVLASQ